MPWLGPTKWVRPLCDMLIRRIWQPHKRSTVPYGTTFSTCGPVRLPCGIFWALAELQGRVAVLQRGTGGGGGGAPHSAAFDFAVRVPPLGDLACSLQTRLCSASSAFCFGLFCRRLLWARFPLVGHVGAFSPGGGGGGIGGTGCSGGEGGLRATHYHRMHSSRGMPV